MHSYDSCSKLAVFQISVLGLSCIVEFRDHISRSRSIALPDWASLDFASGSTSEGDRHCRIRSRSGLCSVGLTEAGAGTAGCADLGPPWDVVFAWSRTVVPSGTKAAIGADWDTVLVDNCSLGASFQMVGVAVGYGKLLTIPPECGLTLLLMKS